METAHIEQGDRGASERSLLRALILQTEDRIRELHNAGGGNFPGMGALEMFEKFPVELKDFIGNVDLVLPLGPEEKRQLNHLIQRAANGVLGEAGHDQELDQLLDYFLRYRSARSEPRH